MSNVPAAARKVVEEAEKLHKSIYQSKPEDENSKADGEVEAKAEKPVPAEKSAQADRPAQAEKPAQEAPPPEENWEHKYKTLQGKYNAEMSRYNEQIRNYQSLLATREKDEEREVAEKETPPRYLKEDEIMDYGEDLIDVIKRAAKEEFEPVITRLRKENEQLRSQVGGVTSNIKQSARQKLLDGMDRQAPGWREINKSQDFVAWLAGTDPFSGQRRHDLLIQAFEANDEARTLAFFKSYQNEHAAVTRDTSQPESSARKPKLDMETMVSPGSPKTTGATRAQEGSERIWSQREISRFYDDVTAGKYRSRPKDKARIEAEIIRAANTGRVR